MSDDDRYLTLPALALYSGLSLSTIARHLKGARPIPAVRVGKRVLVKRSAFDAWVEAAPKAQPAKAQLAADAAAIVRSIRGGSR